MHSTSPDMFLILSVIRRVVSEQLLQEFVSVGVGVGVDGCQVNTMVKILIVLDKLDSDKRVTLIPALTQQIISAFNEEKSLSGLLPVISFATDKSDITDAQLHLLRWTVAHSEMPRTML